MSWFGKGRSDVPRTWVAALEQVLQAVDPTGQLADFVLTGRHAGALKTLKGGRPYRGQSMWPCDSRMRAPSSGQCHCPPTSSDDRGAAAGYLSTRTGSSWY